MSKPFVEDLHEIPEEKARLETKKDEILCQLSEDVDFDLQGEELSGTKQCMWYGLCWLQEGGVLQLLVREGPLEAAQETCSYALSKDGRIG